MAKLSTTITFKESERHLYDFLKSKRSQSGFIKDLIEAHMNGQLLVNPIINQSTQIIPNSSDTKEEESKMNDSKRNLLKNMHNWDMED